MGSNKLISDFVRQGGRVADLLSDRLEPQDGLIQLPASLWTFTGGAFTAFRDALGQSGMRRTSGGAETNVMSVGLSQLVRRIAAMGLKVLDFWMAYKVATVAATSLDVTINTVTFADAATPVNASYGGALTYSVATQLARCSIAQHLVKVTPAAPGYQSTDLASLFAEVTVVMPNTCQFSLYGGGFHVAHDYL